MTEKTKAGGGILAIAILAIVLGLLGGCGSVFGIVGQVFQERMIAQQQDLLAQPGTPPGLAEQQQRMTERMLQVTRKWKIGILAHQALNAVASALLIVAAIFLLRTHPVAPAVFIGAALSNVFVDLGGSLVNFLVQRETSVIMQQTMHEMATSGPGAAPGMDHMMDGIMQASMGVGLCFTAAWALAKILYYVIGAVHLRKATVRAAFAAARPA